MEQLTKRRRPFKPSVGIVCGDIADLTPAEIDEEEWDIPSYYLQISRTLGMERVHGLPEVQTLITHTIEYMGHSVLEDLLRAVREGVRFKAGDRLTLTPRNTWKEPYEVELRESADNYGPCLRAVVLGIEEDFQSLPTEEAETALLAYAPLIDCCANL